MIHVSRLLIARNIIATIKRIIVAAAGEAEVDRVSLETMGSAIRDLIKLWSETPIEFNGEMTYPPINIDGMPNPEAWLYYKAKPRVVNSNVPLSELATAIIDSMTALDNPATKTMQRGVTKARSIKDWMHIWMQVVYNGSAPGSAYTGPAYGTLKSPEAIAAFNQLFWGGLQVRVQKMASDMVKSRGNGSTVSLSGESAPQLADTTSDFRIDDKFLPDLAAYVSNLEPSLANPLKLMMRFMNGSLNEEVSETQKEEIRQAVLAVIPEFREEYPEYDADFISYFRKFSKEINEYVPQKAYKQEKQFSPKQAFLDAMESGMIIRGNVQKGSGYTPPTPPAKHGTCFKNPGSVDGQAWRQAGFTESLDRLTANLRKEGYDISVQTKPGAESLPGWAEAKARGSVWRYRIYTLISAPQKERIASYRTSSTKMDAKTVKRIKALLWSVGQSPVADIPLESIQKILKEGGYTLTQEDGTPWEGFIFAPTESQQRELFEIGKLPKTDNPLEVCEPIDTKLLLTWYKFQTGKYEVVGYLN